MNQELSYIHVKDFTTQSGFHISTLQLSYQLFGLELGTAPVVLVNHALTANSSVIGEYGWWNQMIGKNKTIDTTKFTVIAFNIPGNGYDGLLIDNYKDFVAKDIANIFLLALKKLRICKLHAIIGGSLGGGIAWEMAVLNPDIALHIIPIAADWKSTDWLIANCFIQEQFLLNSKKPVHDARMHAMMCYRTPVSYKEKFNRSIHEELKIFNIESWLSHHGKKLQDRFDYTIIVTAPKEVKIQRVVQRDQISKEEVADRMKNQWSDNKKIKLADFQIENKDLELTKKNVLQLHKHLLSLVNA